MIVHSAVGGETLVTDEVSIDTELFESVELYLRDSLEMSEHLLVTLEGETLHDHC